MAKKKVKRKPATPILVGAWQAHLIGCPECMVRMVVAEHVILGDRVTCEYCQRVYEISGIYCEGPQEGKGTRQLTSEGVISYG